MPESKREGLKPLEDDEIAMSKRSFRNVFVGDAISLTKTIKTKAKLPKDPLQAEKDTIAYQGIQFKRRKNGPSVVWTFKSKDLERVAEVFKLTLRDQRLESKRQTIKTLGEDEIAVSEHSLGKIFVNGNRLSKTIKTKA